MTDNTTLPFPPEVLLEHRAWVRALARSLVRDEHTADDLAQDTMVRALQSMPENTRSPRAWLGTVLRNRFRDHLRTSDRRATREEAAHAPPHGAGAGEIAAQAEIHRHVLDAVLRLDAPFRDVVLLRFFEGLEPAEIAVRLDVPAATVRTRLHRALGKLRRELDAEHGCDDRRWRAALAPLLVGDAASPEAPRTRGASWARPAAAIVAMAVILGAAWGIANVGGRASAPSAPTHVANAPGPSEPARGGQDDREPTRRTRERVDPASIAGGGTLPGAAPDPTTGADETPAAPIPDARALRVHVKDRSGANAVGVAVEMQDGDGWSKTGFSKALARATTDSSGVASFADPPEREVRLIVRTAESAAVAPIVDLSGGVPDSPVEMRLLAATPVHGTVVGADGAPVEGARLTLMLTGDFFGPAGATTSDETGAFAFGVLPREVFASPANVEVTSAGFVQCDHKIDAAGVLAPQAIRLRRAIVVRGRVVDEDGHPLAAVDVTSPDAPSYAETGADGRFVLGGIDPGDANEDGGEEGDPEAVFVRFQSDDHAWRRIDVTTETIASGDLGDVVLGPGRPIRGTVVGSDGSPVPGASLWIEGHHVRQIVANLTCDDEGRFEYLHGGDEDHLIEATAPDVEGFSGASGQLDGVRPGENIRVVVSFVRTILVEFVDAMTGDPVKLTNCVVFIEPIGFEATHTGGGFSDPDGMASVRIRADAAGPYELTVRDFEGWEETVIERVDVREDDETRVTARMRRRDR